MLNVMKVVVFLVFVVVVVVVVVGVVFVVVVVCCGVFGGETSEFPTVEHAAYHSSPSETTIILPRRR